VYTKHQNLPQTSKHYQQSSLHSSVRVIVGVPFSVLSFRGFILGGETETGETCRQGNQGMLLSQGHHTREGPELDKGIREGVESVKAGRMAAARAYTLLAFNVVAAPADGLQARKKLERALHEWFQGERCRFVLFGPGGAGKSTLAVKFAAAQVERGGDGGLRLVFVLSASSMEPDYAGLLGPCPRLARLCHESRSVKTDGA